MGEGWQEWRSQAWLQAIIWTSESILKRGSRADKVLRERGHLPRGQLWSPWQTRDGARKCQKTRRVQDCCLKGHLPRRSRRARPQRARR